MFHLISTDLIHSWIKRGPSGIIGTNIVDAKDTVASIIRDLRQCNKPLSDNDAVASLLNRNGQAIVNWDGYLRIVDAESKRKRSEQQPREKIVSRDEQLQIAHA